MPGVIGIVWMPEIRVPSGLDTINPELPVFSNSFRSCCTYNFCESVEKYSTEMWRWTTKAPYLLFLVLVISFYKARYAEQNGALVFNLSLALSLWPYSRLNMMIATMTMIQNYTLRWITKWFQTYFGDFSLWCNQWTDRPTDDRTEPPIEMRWHTKNCQAVGTVGHGLVWFHDRESDIKRPDAPAQEVAS